MYMAFFKAEKKVPFSERWHFQEKKIIFTSLFFFSFKCKKMYGKFLASSENKLIPRFAKHIFVQWFYNSQAKMLKGKRGWFTISLAVELLLPLLLLREISTGHNVPLCVLDLKEQGNSHSFKDTAVLPP